MSASRILVPVVLVAVAFLPLGLPLAVLSPNLALVKRVELRLSGSPDRVFCEERSWRLLGRPSVRRYGPVVQVFDAFLPVVTSETSPFGAEVFSTLGLRTAAASYFPFAGMRASRQPQSMKTTAMDVIRMRVEVEAYLRNPLSVDPLVLSREQTYPAGFVVFDLLGLVMLAVIGRYWTALLCLAAYLKLSGAPPEVFAAPFIRFFERLGKLAERAKDRK